MQIQFNDTTTYQGLVQFYEDEIGANRGDVSGNTDKLKKFAAYANMALSNFVLIGIRTSGTQQFDDSNQTDYPIVFFNLVSGQRDYAYGLDANSNRILNIHKVAILPSATATLYQEITPVDPNTDSSAFDLIANNTITGIPYQYDKLGNGILLDPIPSYSATNGLKVYISREGSYFAYTDTTKKPGVPVLHEYMYIKPAREYARLNGLATFEKLNNEMLILESKIEQFFASRERDVRHIMTNARRNFR